MVKIIKQEIDIEEALKKKLEFICNFCNTKCEIKKGSIRTIEKTNLSYVEPHRIIIKGITFLAFNYSKTLYVGNLSNKLELKDLETFIKELNKNNYSITNDEINEIKDYIKQTQDTTSNLKTTNDLTTILEHYEDDLKNYSKKVKNLQQKLKIVIIK